MYNRLFSAAFAAAVALWGPSDAQTLRAQVSDPGSTHAVALAHLGDVVAQRHGWRIETQDGIPAILSMPNAAQGKADLAVYSPPLAYFLKTGQAMFADMENHADVADNLRVLFTFSGDLLTLGTFDPDIETVADLAGKTVYLGPFSSALTQMNANLIEAATGLAPNTDYRLIDAPWAASPDLLLGGDVDVMFLLCPARCETWDALSQERPFFLVGFDETMIAQPALAEMLGFPGRLVRRVAPGIWDRQGNAAPTFVMGEISGFVVPAQMSEDVAYALTRAFWETQQDLAFKAPFAEDFEIADAVRGAEFPLHPGAIRFFKELGLIE